MFLTLRILGLVVVAVFAAAGLAVASAILPLLIGLAVLVGLAALCLREEDPRSATSRFGGRPLRQAAAAAGGAVVAVYVVVGMTTLLGGAVTMLAVATALAALGYRRVRRGTARDTGHDPHPGADAAETGDPMTCGPSGDGLGRSPADAAGTEAGAGRLLPADPAALSTTELCRAWRLSYLLLQKARAPEALADAAELRRRYLDEMARRHPAGFRRWLEDGARAAGDPSRYVRRSARPVDPDEDRTTREGR
ncbi:hypothetical protein [Pseudonocardia kunmingensis]|uniref:Uncharacterized protein n=1 Tax=Pseudonocardia kunmingensis TaxID=630975 RepID=A0A543CXJ9_9PSEU|nr:hypothetical protein [Pseudonocardia kunmingensis]TQM01832.1 hypothetical protein FB558_8350 [Pseudonocardia kunmingensis]